jgi:hypothetical protein
VHERSRRGLALALGVGSLGGPRRSGQDAMETSPATVVAVIGASADHLPSAKPS